MLCHGSAPVNEYDRYLSPTEREPLIKSEILVSGVHCQLLNK